MFSEQEIDKLIQPVVDRQAEVNNSIIKIIAERIKRIGELLPSDIFKLEVVAKTGADVKRINSEIARIVGVQVKQIKKIIRAVANDAYQDAKPFYDYRQKTFIPFEENEPIQRVVKAIEKQTSGTYENMAKAQAFMVSDPMNPTVLKPTTTARTYQNTVDKAIQTVQSGLDYQSTMRNTLQEIIDSGLKEVVYETDSGKIYTQRMDTALRRNLLDGVRAINQGVQDEVGKQFGADGYEISVHACPAPDHCLVQGHQFTKEEYAKMAPVQATLPDGSIDRSLYENAESAVDINGNAYPPIRRKIGTLNCRHFAFAIIIGQAPQNYTDEQLQDILDKNDEGYTDKNGKHYTMYECTQMQRKFETKIRRAKDGQIAAKEAGDIELAKKYQKKVTRYLQEYNSFSNGCGLKIKPEKIRVAGYKKLT